MLEKKNYEPKIVAFCCNWCSYAGADGAGTARKHYPANIKIIKVPCSCRVNPLFILRAFQRGADIKKDRCCMKNAATVLFLTKNILKRF